MAHSVHLLASLQPLHARRGIVSPLEAVVDRRSSPDPPALAAVVAALPTPTVLLAADAPDFTVVAASDALLAAVRRTRDDVVGRPLADAIPLSPPSDPDAHGAMAVCESLAAAVRTGTPQRITLHRHDLVRADGFLEPHFWDVRSAPVLDPCDGTVRWVVHEMIDVTARHTADIALRASEEHYRTLFTEIDAAYAVVEVLADDAGRWCDFRFIEVNPPFMRHTGMPWPVGRTATELLGTPNPRWAMLYGHVVDTGEALRLEETEFTLGRRFDLNIVRVGGEGSRRVAVLFTDVTQRRAAEEAVRNSEERLRLAIDATGLGISDWDIVTDRVIANVRFRELFGLAPEVEILGAALMEVMVHPADMEHVGATIGAALDPSSTGRFEVEHRALTPRGERWVLTLGQVHFAGTGAERRAVRLLGNHLDVTARKGAEAALRDSERRRLLALDAAGIGDWSIEVATGILDCSPRARTMHGVTAQEQVTLAMHDALIDPADRAAVQAARASALDPAGNGEYRIEFRFHPPVGAMRWIESVGRGVFEAGPDGPRATHLIGAMVDVTERRRAEDAVRASEARAQALMATLPGAAVFVFDRGLHYRFAGGEAFRAAGFTTEQFVGRTIDQVLEPSLAAQYVPLVTRALAGESFEMEHDAHERIYLTRGGPLPDATGHAGEALAVSVDVTARRLAERALEASEERVRTLVEHVRDYAIFLLDADGIITEWSAGAERVTGYPAAEALGQHLAFIYPPEDVAAGLPDMHLQEAAATGRGEWEGWRMGRAGHRFWANEIATAIRAPDGSIAGFTKITRDLTERRRAEEAMEQARRVAEAERERAEAERARAEDAWRASEAASRAKSEFLNVMSHELRTPLNAIGGYAELLKLGIRGPVTPRQVEDLQRITTSQRHLLGLINEVLNYAKLEAGTVDFAFADVSVAGAIAEAIALVAPQAQAKGLALGVDPCDDALAVRADPDKLRQILLNLLSNAVKFTASPGTPDARSAHIVVHCDASEVAVTGADGARDDDDDDRRDGTERIVRIHVTDTGIGIPADKLAAVFEPFVQVRADLARPHEGTGLGLAISRDLARAMRGDLTLESTPGVGSTFTVALPAAGTLAVRGGDAG